MVTALTILDFGIIFLLVGFIPMSYAQTPTSTNMTAISFNANPLVLFG
jgi:hypothetical protein